MGIARELLPWATRPKSQKRTDTDCLYDRSRQSNDSVEDSRLKVVFHACRHSFASWLVADGTDLFQVKELMSHKTIAMTARYSHLSPDTLKKAVKSMESAMIQAKVIQIRRAG